MRRVRGVDLEEVPPRGSLVVPRFLRDALDDELHALGGQQLPAPLRGDCRFVLLAQSPRGGAHVPLHQQREQLLARHPGFPPAVRLHQVLELFNVRPVPPLHLLRDSSTVGPDAHKLDILGILKRVLRVDRLLCVPASGVPEAPRVPVRSVRALANLVEPSLILPRVKRALALARSLHAAGLRAAHRTPACPVRLDLALPAPVVLAPRAARALIQGRDARVRS